MSKNIILTPKQKRSIATKNKIKKTAKRLFAKEGYYKITSNNIAKEAKVPIGSFYNYFGNKKGLLLELIKDFNADFHAELIPPHQLFIEKTTSQEAVFKNIEQLFTNIVMSSYLSDPFYKIIHALQFTEPDVLVLSEEIRLKEIDLLIELLEQIHRFHPIPNIPLKAKYFTLL